MPKVLLLSDTFSEHTEKWALALASNGIEVGIFSFHKASYPWHKNVKNITVLFEPTESVTQTSSSSKLSYLKYILPLKKAIKQFQPNILHAHYATSYGLIGALCGFKPFVISAWGTDVMKFPQKNWINKAILKFNLKSANAICATSHTIKDYLKPVTDKKVNVIPFGVDINIFCKKEIDTVFEKDAFVIGTIKALEELYNIDIAIKSFAKLKEKYPTKNLKLLIIGEGYEEENLKKLVNDLNITSHVAFKGRVPFAEVSNYFNMLDVLLNLSTYESFGVSVIEAMACQKAVVATNTGGLKEIIENATFGSLVEVGDVNQTVSEIEKYILDEDLKKRVGVAARQKVIEKYNWNNNIKQMIELYNQLINTTV